VLGIGAAAIFPLSLSVIPVLFAPEERQKAIALMASATFISFPIGPIVGGYLLDHFWWGSVFLINVPVVVLAVIAVAVLLPESRSAERPRIDVAGVILSSAGLAALTYGFIKAGQDGWTDAVALGTIAGGAAVLAVLVAWERWLTGRNRAGSGGPLRGGAIRPLIELRLFRSAGFTWGTILATLVSFAMFGIFFAMPQYFQESAARTRWAAGSAAADDRRHGDRHDRQHPAGLAAAGRRRHRQLAAGQREGPGHGGVRDHGGHPRVRRHHHGQQRDRVRGRLVRGVRLGWGWPCRRQ
jgi:Arabinose efflux permease